VFPLYCMFLCFNVYVKIVLTWRSLAVNFPVVTLLKKKLSSGSHKAPGDIQSEMKIRVVPGWAAQHNYSSWSC